MLESGSNSVFLRTSLLPFKGRRTGSTFCMAEIPPVVSSPLPLALFSPLSPKTECPKTSPHREEAVSLPLWGANEESEGQLPNRFAFVSL